MKNIKSPNSALNIHLQFAEDLVYHFFGVDDFMNTCLEFMHKMEAVMAQYSKVYKTEEDKGMEDLCLHEVFVLPPPPGMPHHLITPITFSQEHRRVLMNTNTTISMFINH
jgi:hypothetical protein